MPAFVISVIASVTAVVLAVLPAFLHATVTYRSDVAVLTATLIAIIWYTYFTYVAVHRDEATRLIPTLSAKYGTPVALTLTVRNLSVRTVTAAIKAEIWVGRARPADLAILSGRSEHAVLIDPHGEWQYVTTVDSLFARVQDSYGSEYYHFGDKSGPGWGDPECPPVIARMSVAWRDDLGEIGIVPDRWFRVLGSYAVLAITSAASLRETEREVGPSPSGGPASIP